MKPYIVNIVESGKASLNITEGTDHKDITLTNDPYGEAIYLK